MTADPIQIEADRLRRVIARRIGALVKAGRVDRTALAAATGMTETRLGRVMKESSDLSAVELVMTARHLKVPVGMLTGEINPEQAMTPPRR